MLKICPEKKIVKSAFLLLTLFFTILNSCLSSIEILSSLTAGTVTYFFFIYVFLMLLTVIVTNVVCFFILKVCKVKNVYYKNLSYSMVKYIYIFYVTLGILILLLKINVKNFDEILYFMKFFKFLIINILMYVKILSQYDINKRKKLLIFLIWIVYSLVLA